MDNFAWTCNFLKEIAGTFAQTNQINNFKIEYCS